MVQYIVLCFFHGFPRETAECCLRLHITQWRCVASRCLNSRWRHPLRKSAPGSRQVFVGHSNAAPGSRQVFVGDSNAALGAVVYIIPTGKWPCGTRPFPSSVTRWSHKGSSLTRLEININITNNFTRCSAKVNICPSILFGLDPGCSITPKVLMKTHVLPCDYRMFYLT
jgi:hypothetical protein